MAITKTKVDLIGTAAAKQNITGAGSVLSNARSSESIIGLMIQALVTYGASIPGSDPLVEVFTSDDNANFDTEAYESFYVPRLANNTKQVSYPIRFTEGIKNYKVKISNGATNAIDAWISAVEATI